MCIFGYLNYNTMNKKLIVSLLAAVLCTGYVQAQQKTARKSKWSIAPRVGINFATRDAETGWLTGFHGDVLGQCRFNKVWALEFGLSYSREGYKVPLGKNAWGEVKRDVLNVPMVAKAYVWRGLNLSAGGQFALTGNGDYPGTTAGAGVVMGLGYEMESGLLFAFNYNYGVPGFGSLDGVSWSNITQVCQLSVGWRF